MLKLASASGLLKVGRLALDGTKIKANASRHKAMSYDRMQTEEARLQQEIRDLLAQAEAEDQSDDAQHGANRRGDELPDELQRRESRLKKIREAKAALEAEARAKAAAENEAKNAARAAEGKEPQSINLDEIKPEPKAQRNFTDPDSKIMKASNKGWDRHGRIKRHGVTSPTTSIKRGRAAQTGRAGAATLRLWSMNRNSSSPPMSRRKPTMSGKSLRCSTGWKPTSKPPRSRNAPEISWPMRATTATTTHRPSARTA